MVSSDASATYTGAKKPRVAEGLMDFTAPPAGWLESINAAVSNTVDAKFEQKLAPLLTRIEGLDAKHVLGTKVDEIAVRVSKLESAPSVDLSTRASAGKGDLPWEPQRIERKGWCSWNDRGQGGLTREELTVLHNELMGKLTPDLQQKVNSGPIVYSRRNAKYHVRVDPAYLDEIVSIWKGHLASEGRVCFKDKDVFARAEPSPQRKQRNALLAKTLSFLATRCGNTHTFKIHWAPEYLISATPTQGGEEIIAAELDMTDDGKVSFHADVKRWLSVLSDEELEVALRLHKQRN
eukprot:TRINITY_DN50733_c0_g1_i1.p1 TRINITY_DN50733_c0_g1~~TRINITY_DN50733_c0_g1_i1.p1  ORF type:complete len:293 (-),score=47.01 TRINITY_DN50733_c0_g1_i1:208-1086(-)